MITMLAALALGQAVSSTFDVRGTVSDLTRQSDGILKMLVKAPEKAKAGYDKAWVRVPSSAVVVDPKGRDARSMLRDGSEVGVVFTGPVTRSYPPQATAKRIIVFRERFDASGVISEIMRTGHGLRITVQDPKSKQNLAIATLSPTTAIYRVRLDRRIPATARDLRKGLRVDLAYDGPVLLSMPPQGKAGVVVIR